MNKNLEKATPFFEQPNIFERKFSNRFVLGGIRGGAFVARRSSKICLNFIMFILIGGGS
jgi:hypothetical protein